MKLLEKENQGKLNPSWLGIFIMYVAAALVFIFELAKNQQEIPLWFTSAVLMFLMMHTLDRLPKRLEAKECGEGSCENCPPGCELHGGA